MLWLPFNTCTQMPASKDFGICSHETRHNSCYDARSTPLVDCYSSHNAQGTQPPILFFPPTHTALLSMKSTRRFGMCTLRNKQKDWLRQITKRPNAQRVWRGNLDTRHSCWTDFKRRAHTMDAILKALVWSLSRKAFRLYIRCQQQFNQRSRM